MRKLSINIERRELGAPNAKFSEFAKKLQEAKAGKALARVEVDAIDRIAMKSRLRSALKYEYFRNALDRELAKGNT